MMILASAVLAGSLLATGAARCLWQVSGLELLHPCHEVTSAASAELTSVALVALTSAALAQVAWRMSATSTSASDGADLAAAFTTTASIAHITGLIPGRTPAPTEC